MSCHAELNCSRELLRNKNEREFRWNVEQHFRWRRIATSAHPHIDRKINKIGQLKERFNESTIIHKTDQQIDINTNQANYNLVFWHFFLYFWCSYHEKAISRDANVLLCRWHYFDFVRLKGGREQNVIFICMWQFLLLVGYIRVF